MHSHWRGSTWQSSFGEIVMGPFEKTLEQSLTCFLIVLEKCNRSIFSSSQIPSLGLMSTNVGGWVVMVVTARWNEFYGLSWVKLNKQIPLSRESPWVRKSLSFKQEHRDQGLCGERPRLRQPGSKYQLWGLQALWLWTNLLPIETGITIALPHRIVRKLKWNDACKAFKREPTIQ